MRGKVNRNEFLVRVARRADMPVEEIRRIYDAMYDEMGIVLLSGKDLSLTGLGTFTLKTHRGHPVQFEAKSGNIPDYVVLKFIPSGVLTSKLRDGDGPKDE